MPRSRLTHEVTPRPDHDTQGERDLVAESIATAVRFRMKALDQAQAGRSAEAIKIKTQELTIPQGRDLELATQPIRSDPSIGMRFARQEYERLMAERDRQWAAEEESDLGASLEQTYRRARGVSL